MIAFLLGVTAVLSAVLGLALVVSRSRESRCAELEARLEREGGQSAQLERTNRLFEAVLDAVPEGLVVCDEAGVTILRNKSAQVFVEARHGDVLVEQAIDELVAGGATGDFTQRDLDLLGPPPRMVSVSAQPLSEENRLLGSVVVVEDVSERRRLDDVRRDFVANISHELKTPVGALGLLAETISAEDDVEVIRRLARRMVGEAFRVARMIDDLLDLSRIEVDDGSRRASVPLHQLIAAAADRVMAMANDRGIGIDLLGVDRDLVVIVDAPQLISAVGNLLENACKYSHERSTVRVSTSRTDSWVEIAVEDRGLGIPPRDLERVFERFYRVDRARSRETGGTGLGLSIVRHVATNHGGEVRVDSIEGEGSVFTLRLPAQRSSQPEMSAPAETSSHAETSAQAQAPLPGWASS
ncbi:MAG: ATP-binding protein [Acidimicrobiales bacterium]